MSSTATVRRSSDCRYCERYGKACGRPHPTEVHGQCTACGAVEVRLYRPTGTVDLSHIGESATYPTGFGCEMCA